MVVVFPQMQASQNNDCTFCLFVLKCCSNALKLKLETEVSLEKKMIAVNLDNEKENEDEYLNKFGLLYTIY